MTQRDLLLIPTIGDNRKVLSSNHELITHLQRLAQTQTDIASNCSVHFISRSGLLKGKTATTIGATANLWQDYPDVDLQAKQFVTQSDNIFCAAGGSAIWRYC